jgi:hypothetical protein
LAASAGLALICGGTTSQGQAVSQRPGTYGYVLRTWYYPVEADSQTCPKQSIGALEMFEQSLSEAERAQFGGPSNREKLIKLMAERLGLKNMRLAGTMRAEKLDPAELERLRVQAGIAPGKGALVSLGSRLAYDTCTNPEDFPQFARGNQEFLGSTSIGANLDGRVSKGDFTSPDGTRGVDNNLVRATGCNLGVKDYGDSKLAEKSLRSQTAPTVIELSGVDDFINDSDVTLRVYAAAQSVEVAANGDALPFASMDVDPDPRYSAEVKAAIRDGVLSTEPFAFTMRQKESVVETYNGFVDTRLSIRFSPDGSLIGEAFGYQTLDSLDYTYRHFSQAAADFSATSCPAMVAAIHSLADGSRDPRSGRFTAISSAYRFSAVPVFLIHPENSVAGTTHGARK